MLLKVENTIVNTDYVAAVELQQFCIEFILSTGKSVLVRGNSDADRKEMMQNITNAIFNKKES